MATNNSSDPIKLLELQELAKLSGTEYLLIDNGDSSLKIAVDTLLGYISGSVKGSIASRPINCPFGTIMMSITENAESDFEERFGGNWTTLGSTTMTVGSTQKTMYVYQKISKDNSGISSNSSSSGSGLVEIPDGEELPAVSRNAGVFYLNVVSTSNAHFNDGGSGNTVVVGSNMGLKVVE